MLHSGADGPKLFMMSLENLLKGYIIVFTIPQEIAEGTERMKSGETQIT